MLRRVKKDHALSKNSFNGPAGKDPQFNEYTLTLRADAGGRKEDPDALSQALGFNAKLGEWLDQQGLRDSGAVKRTETLGPSAEGLPQVRITCTAEAFGKISKKYGHLVTAASLREAPQEKGTIYPPGRNCWDPRKWKGDGNKP